MYIQKFSQAEDQTLHITDVALEVEGLLNPLTGQSLSIPLNHIVLISGSKVVVILYLVAPDPTSALPVSYPTSGLLLLNDSSRSRVLQHPLLSTFYKSRENRQYVDIIINKTCGDQTADAYLRGTLIGLLSFAACKYKCYWTKGVDDASRIVREIVARRKEVGDTEVQKAVLIMGGDGTIHEVLNGLQLVETQEDRQGLDIDLILS